LQDVEPVDSADLAEEEHRRDCEYGQSEAHREWPGDALHVLGHAGWQNLW